MVFLHVNEFDGEYVTRLHQILLGQNHHGDTDLTFGSCDRIHQAVQHGRRDACQNKHEIDFAPTWIVFAGLNKIAVRTERNKVISQF